MILRQYAITNATVCQTASPDRHTSSARKKTKHPHFSSRRENPSGRSGSACSVCRKDNESHPGNAWRLTASAGIPHRSIEIRDEHPAKAQSRICPLRIVTLSSEAGTSYPPSVRANNAPRSPLSPSYGTRAVPRKGKTSSSNARQGESAPSRRNIASSRTVRLTTSGSAATSASPVAVCSYNAPSSNR